MESRNAGVTADALFVGVTRPPMRFGVTYAALLLNAAFTMELFLLTKNLLVLLMLLPIHGVCMLLCARDARYFDLLMMWAKTRLLGYFSSILFWKGSSYSPLTLDLPDRRGRRRAAATARDHRDARWMEGRIARKGPGAARPQADPDKVRSPTLEIYALTKSARKQTVRIAEAAEIVLKESAVPMHARDIAAAIASKNLFEFKTKDPASVVSKALRKSENFIKTGAGVFEIRT